MNWHNRSQQARPWCETEEAARHSGGALGWITLGAGMMYLFDPARGARRRSLLRDKLVSALHATADCVDCTARDAWHRARGTFHEASHLLRHEDVDDVVLVERVRSKMGRVVSHPHAVRVTAEDGIVHLFGPVLEEEFDDLVSTIRHVRGVRDLDCRGLEVFERPGNVPTLQGGPSDTGERFELAQVNWSPTTRLLVGAGGAALGGYAVAKRNLAGAVLGALGLGLLMRATTNVEAGRLVGAGAGRRAVTVQKTINIDAPVDEVWSFWSNYDNFPLFMHNVREVRDYGSGRSHWVVAGPAGVPVEWDAQVTAWQPDRLLAWKSVPGSVVANAGIVRFESNGDGSTRVVVRLSYNPPGGAIGHAVASLFGADPKSEMDQDLSRMKTLIETGTFPRDAAKHPASVNA